MEHHSSVLFLEVKHDPKCIFMCSKCEPGVLCLAWPVLGIWCGDPFLVCPWYVMPEGKAEFVHNLNLTACGLCTAFHAQR